MNTVTVFTAKDLDKILVQGGSGNWKLDPARVRKCEYAILTANSHHPKTQHGLGVHQVAFMIGKVSGVTGPVYDDLGNQEPGRYLIQFSEYAEVEIPQVWKGLRNPVKYGDTSELDIDLDSLTWKPFPAGKAKVADRVIPALTIDEAKRGIAAKLGIKPGAIDITIRT